jgi:hypothetical protein
MKQPAYLPVVPRDLPNPGKPSFPIKTLDRWDQFIGSVASGMKLAEAMEKHYIARDDIESVTRSDPIQFQRFMDATRAAKRRSWSVLDIQEVLDRVSSGMKVADAVAEVTGSASNYMGFLQIVNQNAELKLAYREAKEVASLGWSETLMDMANDDSDDVIESEKETKSGAVITTRLPNGAAVQRSKLQVDTQYRLMSAWHGKQFGEKKDTQVTVNVNHAEVLEEARERARNQGRITRQEKAQAIEAEVVPVLPDDTSWMDAEPSGSVSTIWREEK